MKRIAVLSLALALAAVTACKKKEAADTQGGTDTKGGTKGTAPKPDSGPWASWDMAARRAAFAGAHVTPGDALGQWQAWNVTGDKVTIWNGTAEKTLELSVISPCEAKTTEKRDGGSSSTTSHYTLIDGKIAMGLGNAGSRKGPEAVACISNAVFTVDAAGKCTEWSASMFDNGKYEQKPGTCGFRKDGDTEVFAATVHGSESVLQVHGDALTSDQLWKTHSEPAADFAAAKTARDAKQ